MRIIFFLVLFSCILLNAQEYIVVNELNATPVSFANIDFLNGKGTTTDRDGKFILHSRIDSIKITSLGFIPRAVNLSSISPQNKILLQESAIALEEVSLFNKKSKILKHKGNLSPDLPHRYFTHDEKIVTFIPFPDIQSDNITIKNIVVDISKRGVYKKSNHYPFKVNLYKVQTKYHPPLLKDSLISGIITSREKDKPSQVKINVVKHNIPLPLEGIYVSFETLDKRIYPQDSIYEYDKRFNWHYRHAMNAPAVKTIKLKNKQMKSYSYKLIRRRYIEINGEEINEDYWELEKDLIYDITLELEY